MTIRVKYVSGPSRGRIGQTGTLLRIQKRDDFDLKPTIEGRPCPSYVKVRFDKDERGGRAHTEGFGCAPWSIKIIGWDE